MVDAWLIKKLKLGDAYFFVNRDLFRRLKMDIALVIPASIIMNVETNISTGHGLTVKFEFSAMNLQV